LQGQRFALTEVRGIAFTGQMHTAVLLDSAGQLLKPTILWLDRRAAAETEELSVELLLPPYQINSTYTLPKLLWLKRNRPEVVERIRTILWPKDYLRYRLTGVLGTDITEAGGAALLDWETQTWATDRLGLVGLDTSVLPPVREANAIVGSPLSDVAGSLGINADAQVIVGMGDVAALIGGAPPKPGRVVCSMGSSSMVFMALADDQHPRDPTHRLYIYPLRPYRLLGGVSSTTGAALTWAYNNFARYAAPQGFGPPGLARPGLRQPVLADRPGRARAPTGRGEPFRSFESVMLQASNLAPGADGLCFIPYLAGERSPYWLDNIKGGFYGLGLSHDTNHIIRAVMEGVASSLRHLLDIYRELEVPVKDLVLAGGGAKTPGLCQIIADICQQDVSIYTEEETVTRVLYALCQSALNQAGFNETLVNTFPQPEAIHFNPDYAAVYEHAYQAYRRFADFAWQEAIRPSR